MPVEPERIRQLNGSEPKTERKYVLYWAQMNRRVDSNHGLLYAVELANQHGLPLLYYEGLASSHPSASDRFHTFILQGVPETAKRLEEKGIGYCFYLRKRREDPNEGLYELAKCAAALVTDDYPTSVARQHNARVSQKLDIPYCVVDSSCVVPMNKIEKRQYAAYTIRPRIHRLLPDYLHAAEELKVRHRYDAPGLPWHTEVQLNGIRDLVAECEIDHSVKPSPSFEGGRVAAEKQLAFFLEQNLRRYARGRNNPAEHATSDLSPYLHFGQISSLEVALAAREYAEKHKLVAAEFLEELIVRRELSFNYARFVDNPGSLQNLPEWARETMRKHACDKRDPVYTRAQLERAETYDELWNASQKELLLRGKIHGYYRMYWGKKIIEWSPTYEEAAETMIYLHDRYALDGRDPNTYTNILWCFGLHDRPWGERSIYGSLRYMSFEGMKRKTGWKAYVDEIRLMECTGKDPYRPERV
jgi:deoxyribodipyrimidine photo-lyase